MKLQTKKLCWQANANTPWILDKVDFNAKEGHCIGLLGPNGSGKTSLIRCLFRSIQGTRGQVFLDGRDISRYSRQEVAKKVAVVMQEYPPDFHLSVDEIIQLGRLPHDTFFSKPALTEDDDVILQRLELDSLRYRAFNTLSGGEKQRVMIARALVQKAEILLLDEPTNHLDIAHQLSVLKLTRTLGITVISSLHDLNLASQFCDEVAVMKQGKMLTQGPPKEVLSETLIHDVFSVKSTADTHPKTGSLRLSFY
ncbi:MAG: ABC transporter ATP-binding protein [Bermanella sp.]